MTHYSPYSFSNIQNLTTSSSRSLFLLFKKLYFPSLYRYLYAFVGLHNTEAGYLPFVVISHVSRDGHLLTSLLSDESG